MSLINSITSNYKERIERLALFDPLYKLENKKGKDNKGNPIDYFSLGLLSLLFFYENMLIRNKKTGVKELALFFAELNNNEIDLDLDGFESVARNIIDTFRPASGKRNAKFFYNWEIRKEEVIQYSILKADKWDNNTNVQYYTLDDGGLELIFATKEYFSEFQLSINQLLLRKQLEKGEFVGALRQIDEMHLDVRTLHDRIYKIKHEIQRNIISNETYERYKNIVDDINLRLNREKEEFDELMDFVKETKDKLSYELNNEKDRKTYELIIQIDKELGDVHYEHAKLLEESIVLKTTALQAALESLYYAGIDSFNFNQEITLRFIATPLPLEASRELINPFLYLDKYETWSPLAVFAPQRVEKDEEEEKSSNFLTAKGEETIKKDIKLLKDNYKVIMEIVIKAMEGRKTITLKEVVEYSRENSYEYLLEERMFYDFWIILHQKSPLSIEQKEDNLFSEALKIIEGKYLNVIETVEIIKVNERFSINNMIFMIEE